MINMSDDAKISDVLHALTNGVQKYTLQFCRTIVNPRIHLTLKKKLVENGRFPENCLLMGGYKVPQHFELAIFAVCDNGVGHSHVSIT